MLEITTSNKLISKESQKVDIDNIPKSHFLKGKQQQQQIFWQSEESQNPMA